MIEAIQWDGLNHLELNRFVGKQLLQNFRGELLIQTLEGEMRVSINDWVIKGVKGEFYPCKPDIFEQTYEEVKQNG